MYCLLGDGELDEGQVWESLATIHKYQLNNLIILIDKNNVQLDGHTQEIKNMDPLPEKLSAFGFTPVSVDGHHLEHILAAFVEAQKINDEGKPAIIIFNTIKGKGVSFMENTSEWHGKAPNKEEYEKAMKELEEHPVHTIN